MPTLPPSVRIWCATTPTDLCRGPDGLAALVRSQLHADPLSGHLFVFFNRKADRLKVLYWDRDGMCIWYKRLERGRFHYLRTDTASWRYFRQRIVELSPSRCDKASWRLLAELAHLPGARPRVEGDSRSAAN
jgi:transposase